MYLMSYFWTLVLTALLALSLVPGIIPPLASAEVGKHPCISIDKEGAPPVRKECSGRKDVCSISVVSGLGVGCQQNRQNSCPPDVPHDGTIRCGPSGCCCIDPEKACNDHTDPAIKDKICAVPELQASKLCCPQGGCTAGVSPGKTPTGPGGSSSAAATFSGLITGTVGILTLAVL